MYEDLEDIIRTAWIWHQNDATKGKSLERRTLPF
jgi:hypothetical protein